MKPGIRTCLRKVTDKLRNYAGRTDGAIAPLFMLVLPVLLLATGMAVDTALAHMARERLSHALDAAALAAAATEVEGEDITDKVEKFLEANYPPEKIGTPYDLNVEVDGERINVTASALYETLFMKVVGVGNITVDARTQVTREVQGIEVVLVLDVTGSMAGHNNYQELQKATQAFIQTMFSRVRDSSYIRISIVPYAASVNVGSVGPDIIEPGSLPRGVMYDPDDDNMWAGCVMARAADDDQLDTDVDEGGYWQPLWWESSDDNDWEGEGILTRHRIRYEEDDGYTVGVVFDTAGNNKRTPNLGCPVNNPIVPLTSNQAVLQEAAEGLTYWNRGGTMSVVGMVWGWRALSQKPPFEEGRAEDDIYWRKYAIIMTDGDSGFYRDDKTAYERISDGVIGTTNSGTARTRLNERFVNVCDGMKDDGISLYSVIFTSSVSETTRDYYRDCSGVANYEEADDSEDLIPVFVKIAKEISTLHISY